MKPEIILEIDSKGKNVLIEVKGVPGRQCMETTQFLENALGEIAGRDLKNEYFTRGARIKGRIRTAQKGGPGTTDKSV